MGFFYFSRKKIKFYAGGALLEFCFSLVKPRHPFNLERLCGASCKWLSDLLEHWFNHSRCVDGMKTVTCILGFSRSVIYHFETIPGSAQNSQELYYKYKKLYAKVHKIVTCSRLRHLNYVNQYHFCVVWWTWTSHSIQNRVKAIQSKKWKKLFNISINWTIIVKNRQNKLLQSYQ